MDCKDSWQCVLVLSGIELIFFTSVGLLLVLCWKQCWKLRDVFLLLIRVCTEPWPLLLLTHPSTAQWAGIGHSWDSCPHWPRGHCRPYGVGLSIWSWGKKEEAGNIRSDLFYLSKSSLRVLKPDFPGGGWKIASPWKWWINSLFHFACMSGFCFTS